MSGGIRDNFMLAVGLVFLVSAIVAIGLWRGARRTPTAAECVAALREATWAQAVYLHRLRPDIENARIHAERTEADARRKCKAAGIEVGALGFYEVDQIEERLLGPGSVARQYGGGTTRYYRTSLPKQSE